MVFPELSEELKEVIQGLTAYYEDSLKRAFQNEGIGLQRLPKPRSLDDILVTKGDNIIELRDLSLMRWPDFRVKQMTAELGKLNLNVVLSLGDLKVAGDYEANNRTLQKFLPVTHSGKIEVTLKNVTAAGKIGLYVREDSFVIENYDIEYTPQNVAVLVSYIKDDSGIPAEDEVVEDNIDNTLASIFWPELKDTLTNMLHRQLGAVIVEDSVTELLAGHDEELREHSRKRALKANRMSDSLLCKAKDQLVSGAFRMLSTPNLGVVFKGQQAGQKRGALEAAQGYVKDLSTLTRAKDFSLYETEEKVVVYGSISLREFKHGHEKYTCTYAETAVEGSIRSIVYRNAIFLKMSLYKSNEKWAAHLEDVQVRTVKDLVVDVSGLGSLSWLAQRVESWSIGNLRSTVLPLLDKQITEAFGHAIQRTDIEPLLKD